ncbi:hypothetical protein FRC12_020320 [Ceratobasidium sp. 428]|nr:hypothetical protein FRC12_020320 [Ceratobasidium sp. 428]
MPQCNINVDRRSKSFFTNAEQSWLNQFVKPYAEFRAVARRTGQNLNKMRQPFVDKVKSDFFKEFPYRKPPKNTKWTFTSAQKRLRMGTREHQQFHKRLVDRLGNVDRANRRKEKAKAEEMKSKGTKKGTSTKTTVDEVVLDTKGKGKAEDEESDDYVDYESDEDLQGPTTAGTDNDVVSDDAESVESEPEDNAWESTYTASDSELRSWRSLIRYLTELAESSWAEETEHEIKRRQQTLVFLLPKVLKLINRGTGAELQATAVWHDGESVNVNESASPASLSFLKEVACAERGDLFVRYVHRRLGPALCTKLEIAHPTVYGEPSRSYQPTLPPLTDDEDIERLNLERLFDYTWCEYIPFPPVWIALNRDVAAWGGGQLPAPWDRIKNDGETGAYHIVERAVMPTGVRVLKHPSEMSAADVVAWSHHLRANPSDFYFRQPRPGMVYSSLPLVPSPTFAYRPEAHLYARWKMEDVSDNRFNGLPLGAEDTYLPLTDEQLAEISAEVGGCEAITRLLVTVIGYEGFDPYQATALDYTRTVSKSVHIRAELPAPTAALEHLHHHVDVNGRQLPRPCFDTTNDARHSYDVASCVSWIMNEPTFRHLESGTFIGGPYGVKWAALLLAHLYAGGKKILENKGPDFGDIRGEWRSLDQRTIETCAHDLSTALDESGLVLLDTQDERKMPAQEPPESPIASAYWAMEQVEIVPPLTPLDEWKVCTALYMEQDGY